MATPSRDRRRSEAQRGRAGRANGSITRQRRAAEDQTRRRAKGEGRRERARTGGSGYEAGDSCRGRPSSASDDAVAVLTP